VATSEPADRAARGRPGFWLAILLGLAITVTIAVALDAVYPIPDGPTGSTIGGPGVTANTPSDGAFRPGTQGYLEFYRDLAAYEQGQARRTRDFSLVGLLVGAGMAGVGFALERRNPTLGQTLVAGALFTLAWANARLYAYRDLLSDHGFPSTVFVAALSLAVAMYVCWRMGARRFVPGRGETTDRRLERAFSAVSLAGALSWMLTVAWIWGMSLVLKFDAYDYGNLPGFDSVVGTGVGLLSLPDPFVWPSEYRLVYGVVLTVIGLALYKRRVGGLSEGFLVAGYAGLVMCVLSAWLRWADIWPNRPTSMLAGPVAVVVLVIVSLALTKKGARSGGARSGGSRSADTS
jgi:hypothetical protein